MTDRDIRRCVRLGQATVAAVAQGCGASTGCGGCRPLVSKIVEAEVEAQKGSRLQVLQAALIGG